MQTVLAWVGGIGLLALIALFVVAYFYPDDDLTL
jgi:hypothetical protein